MKRTGQLRCDHCRNATYPNWARCTKCAHYFCADCMPSHGCGILFAASDRPEQKRAAHRWRNEIANLELEIRKLRRPKSGWRKVAPTLWVHSSGCAVHHCGHPTALYPYYGELLDGSCPTLVSDGEKLGYGKPPPKGKEFVPKFAHLADAQEWIEEQQQSAAARWLELEKAGLTDLLPPARSECRQIIRQCDRRRRSPQLEMAL
jgi:hypothetical protein